MKILEEDEVKIVAYKRPSVYSLLVEFPKILLLRDIKVEIVAKGIVSCLINNNSVEASNPMNFLEQHGWPSRYFRVKIPVNLIAGTDSFCLNFSTPEGKKFSSEGIETSKFFNTVEKNEINNIVRRTFSSCR